jgi:hypothetical protein
MNVFKVRNWAGETRIVRELERGDDYIMGEVLKSDLNNNFNCLPMVRKSLGPPIRIKKCDIICPFTVMHVSHFICGEACHRGEVHEGQIMYHRGMKNIAAIDDVQFVPVRYVDEQGKCIIDFI